MSQTLSKANCVERIREAGGQLERRRGGVSSNYWNNYWTAPSQPSPPLWHIQQVTVAALIRDGTLRVLKTYRGAPSRCVLA